MKDPALQTLPGLLNGIWGQWWARVKPGQAVAVGTLAEFATAARKLHAAGFRPLLFLDELEQLVWRPGVFDDALFDAWLELGREGAIGFATTAHIAPAELLAQAGYGTRFYELFRQLDLGLLDDEAARALLVAPAERAGLAVPTGVAEALLAQAGPQPFFLQLAGHYLYEALAGGVVEQRRRAERPRADDGHVSPAGQRFEDGGALAVAAEEHRRVADAAAGGVGVGDG